MIMLHNPALLHGFLQHLTDALITYCCYQIESGAQVVQLFDSWAHHLSPEQFQEFSLPYANKVTEGVRARYPHVPIIFHANGGERAPPARPPVYLLWAACVCGRMLARLLACGAGHVSDLHSTCTT